MIFVHDRGQMCNNILQYGHVYAWCREHRRSVMSMRFAYKYQYFRICHTRHHNFLAYAVAKHLAKAGIIPTVDFDIEDPATPEEMDALMRRHATMLVDGWAVRFPDLFAKYRTEIVNLFAFDDDVERHVAEMLAPEDDGSVLRLGVHIRRGDYARFLGGRYFYDDMTYMRLIDQFSKLFPGRRLRVYVCGNDPELDHEAFRRCLSDVSFSFPQGSPGQDLCLLSHCDYIIGAPSTFSLVAAMYRDLPLYWILDKQALLREESFQRFDTLFRRIDDVFGKVDIH